MITIDEKEIGLNDKKLRLWGVPSGGCNGYLVSDAVFFQGKWDLFWKYLIASVIVYLDHLGNLPLGARTKSGGVFRDWKIP